MLLKAKYLKRKNSLLFLYRTPKKGARRLLNTYYNTRHLFMILVDGGRQAYQYRTLLQKNFHATQKQPQDSITGMV